MLAFAAGAAAAQHKDVKIGFLTTSPSVRGPYKYGNNHFPIQNSYLQEAVKEEGGSYTLRTTALALKDHQDRYHEKCGMKW
jgi:branched-chain amino acid transport system substrate-binding protein